MRFKKQRLAGKFKPKSKKILLSKRRLEVYSILKELTLHKKKKNIKIIRKKGEPMIPGDSFSKPISKQDRYLYITKKEKLKAKKVTKLELLEKQIKNVKRSTNN